MNDILKSASAALQKAVDEKNRKRLEEERAHIVANIGKDLVGELKPFLSSISDNSKINQSQIYEAMSRAISDSKLTIEKADAPVVNIPPFPEFPSIPAPVVNYNPPAINLPRLEWPKENMPIEGWVRLQGVNMQNPLPVQLRNADGSPANLFENLTTLVNQGGGGGARVVKISSFDASAFSSVTNPDGRLKVELPTGSSGLTDNELRASHLDVQQLSGATDSVYLTGMADSTFSILQNGDGRLRVSVETGGSGLTDSELRASSVPVEQVSGANWSVSVTGFSGSVSAMLMDADGNYRGTLPVEATNLDIRDLDYTTDDVSAYQVSGSIWSVMATANSGVDIGDVTINNASGASAVNIQDGGNTITVDGSVTVSATNLDIRDLVDTSDSIRAYQLSGAAWSVMATANSGVDIGDVTINNASGASAVNIQDGGNTITVDGAVTVSATDLDVRDLVNTSDSVRAYQLSGASWSVEATQSGTWNIGTITTLTGVTNSIETKQVSGFMDSVVVKEIFGSAIATLLNGDNRIPVSIETGAAGLTDTELRASSVPVEQVSGSQWSTSATQAGTWNIGTVTAVTAISNALPAGTNNIGDVDILSIAAGDNNIGNVDIASIAAGDNNIGNVDVVTMPTVTVQATDFDVRDLVNTSDSVRVYQLSGASWSVEATQSGTWNIGTVTAVTGITNSVSAYIVDSGGVGYNGSNPMPITGTVLLSGSLTSAVVVGDTVSDAADSGSAPNKVGGIARTTNPTAVADGDRVSFSSDKVGRQITRPFQMRDMIASAYVSATTGTETTLLSATAGAMFDLVYVVCANQSDAATRIDFRGVTGGNVLLTIAVPASGTAGLALPVPLPQTSSDTGNAWTYDMPDITGTTVNISALFTREV